MPSTKNSDATRVLRRLLDWIYDAAGYLAAFFVFAIFAVMIAASVMRELSIKTGGIEDLVAWLCAAAAFLAMPHAFRHGDFVRMELLISRLPALRRRAFEIGALALGVAFCAYLTFWAVRMTWGSYEYGVMSDGLLVLPIWIPQIAFVLGALLLLIAMLDEFVCVLMGHRPVYVTAVEERHARGDFSEDL